MALLRQSARPDVAAAIERLLREGSDRELCRVNALAFAAAHGLGEEQVIGGFLHAARLGLFELSWSVLCPSCGGVVQAGSTVEDGRPPRIPLRLLRRGLRAHAR